MLYKLIEDKDFPRFKIGKKIVFDKVLMLDISNGKVWVTQLMEYLLEVVY